MSDFLLAFLCAAAMEWAPNEENDWPRQRYLDWYADRMSW